MPLPALVLCSGRTHTIFFNHDDKSNYTKIISCIWEAIMINEKIILQKLNNFYDSLGNKTNIFYMFFTSGLLFWAAKSLSLIPHHVNLVLICAGLDKEEIQWVKKNVKRSVFFIDLFFNDGRIWDLLFNVNKENFGWIDIDCFVFNPNIFYRISQIKKIYLLIAIGRISQIIV